MESSCRIHLGRVASSGTYVEQGQSDRGGVIEMKRYKLTAVHIPHHSLVRGEHLKSVDGRERVFVLLVVLTGPIC